MSELAEYQALLVGRALTNLFFTKQDGPHDYMPGISPAYYFSTILELDNQTRWRFSSDYIVEWKDEEPLITLTNENWNLPQALVFKGQKIVDLALDDAEQLIFYLENGTTICHTMDYGDQLFIVNPNVPENSTMDRRESKNAFVQRLSNLLQTWRQKFKF